MTIELKITADSAVDLANQILGLGALLDAPRQSVDASTSQTEVPQTPRRARKAKDDGVVLQSRAHPEPETQADVPEDISEAAIEAVEIEVEEPAGDQQAERPEVPPISYEDDVKPAVLRLAMTKTRDAVFKVLAEFGAEKSAQEVDPADYGKLLERIDAEMEA